MASIRKFKKEINDVLSEIIEDCYVCQLKLMIKYLQKLKK